MDVHRWEYPRGPDSNAEQVAWLEDHGGRFVGVEDARQLHSASTGDLERFDPKHCPECKHEAGWLPPAFQRCPRCGHELEPWYPDSAMDVAGYWPQEVLLEPAVPTGERIQNNPLPLPPGSRLTFVRIPRRDGLVALDGNNGAIWVWNRPAREWRHLLPATPEPTGYHGVPPRLFGALAINSLLVYPTQHGTVWIDTDSHSEMRAEVSDWKPIAAPAWLSGRCVIPAFADGRFVVAIRGPRDPDWQTLEIHQQADAPAVDPQDPIWLARPIVETHQIHWAGLRGRLYLNKAGKAEWHGWHSNFEPILENPPLQTLDNRHWVMGQAPNEDGNGMSRAFATMAVQAAAECKSVNGVFFTLGRLCLRYCYKYKDTPWNDSDQYLDRYSPCGEDDFLLPLSVLGSEDALMLKIGDVSQMHTLLDQNVEEISGSLVLGRKDGRIDDMQLYLRLDRSHWPQVFEFSKVLYLFEPLGPRLFAWSMT